MTWVAANAQSGFSPNALVRISVASLRSAPAHSAELETQALCGTPVYVDTAFSHPDWTPAILPDGYSAFIHRSAVQILTPEALSRWRSAHRVIVTDVNESHVVSDTISGKPVSDMVLGCILEGRVDKADGWTAVTLPDGRQGYIRTASVAYFHEHMNRYAAPDRIIDIAEALLGVPYLWGGNSTKSVDCSGLTKICYGDAGVMLPRNASAQAECGVPIELSDFDTLQPGDIIFFANAEGRITHVGLSKGGTHYIHASGMVHESSYDPADPLYNGRVPSHAVRIAAPGQQRGIRFVREHDWYF
ncbi:MAG: C40 family peptidase [Muribaculaceae bacterium]|nr:C40 family peptidase [Muribaculaceae bacterium]